MKLVIENLTKTYKNGVKAIDNLSIEIGTVCLVYWGQMVQGNHH